MDNATIVTLSGSPSNSDVATYEQAFGEFSEARGRGRNRRAKRKKDRQEKRQEKRQRRISMRGERKKARQTMRADQQESRQLRKDTRKTRRVARKSMGEDEPELEDQMLDQNETYQNEGQYDEQGQGGGQGQYEEQGGEQGHYSQEESSEEEWGGSSPQYDEYEYDEYEYGGDTSEDESGFDGLIATEDYFSEFNDEGRVRVRPEIRDITKKMEWNKQLIIRLKAERLKALNSGDKNQLSEIDSRIFGRTQRLNELQNSLSNFSNASGKAKGREVRKAKAMARKEHRVAVKQRRRAKIKQARENKMRNSNHGGCETPVENELNPQFTNQRIEVPAESLSKATGTGLNGLDLQDDFDSPQTRIVELTSNIEGDAQKKASRKKLIIGVTLGIAGAVVVILLLKKFKVIGK